MRKPVAWCSPQMACVIQLHDSSVKWLLSSHGFYSSGNSLLPGLTAQVPPAASRRKGRLSNPGLPGPRACIFYLCAVQTDSHLPFFFLRLQFKGSAPRMPSEEESLFSMGSSALEFGWRLRQS